MLHLFGVTFLKAPKWFYEAKYILNSVRQASSYCGFQLCFLRGHLSRSPLPDLLWTSLPRLLTLMLTLTPQDILKNSSSSPTEKEILV